MAESFDAVLADGRELCTKYDSMGAGHAAQPIRDLLDRLQSAHEAQLNAAAETAFAQHQFRVEAQARADRAVGLLRELADEQTEEPQAGSLLARIDAFLSEQAGERENGDG